MEERYHATTQNQFYSDMSNVNKNITVEAKLISPPKYIYERSRLTTLQEEATSSYKLLVLRTNPHGTISQSTGTM
jgi:hypothetical protein